MKVVFCTPTVTRPYPAYVESMEATAHLFNELKIENQAVFTIGNPYISYARAELTHKALQAGADVLVYVDHDLEWRPQDMLKLIMTDGDVVSGTYRFKMDDEQYMGTIRSGPNCKPLGRADGCIEADWVPAGFLKVTAKAVHKIMFHYPELVFGVRYKPMVDLFNHGVHDGLWYGEDYAFSRRWNATGNKIWLVPDLDLTHHATGKSYPGNFHRFLLNQPGGANGDRS